MARNDLIIEGKAFRDLLRRIEEAGETFPDVRREMFERIAQELPELVNAKIAAANPPIRGTTVQSWQENPGRVGSKGGYAAIAPRRNTYKVQGSRQYAVGYLTNALVSGAKTRMPASGPRRRPYVPRLKYGQIRKRPFYAEAARQFQSQKSAIVEQFAQELANLLKGAQ